MIINRRNKIIKVADLFCGAGGTSIGMVEALKNLGLKVELTAINHWDVAIATHHTNLPGSRTFCNSVNKVNPREVFADGELDILWASPECMHHSVARGGKPINEQSRSTAWDVMHWVEVLRPPVVLIENVKEFPSWGPCDRRGRPIKSKKGHTYNAWDACFKSFNYRTGTKVLTAADFGDPTTRERFFYMAVLSPRKIVFPFPTHSQSPMEDLLQATLKPWVPARDIIDWGIESQSIFERKRSLKPKTIRRIFFGLRKFGLRPFLVPQSSGPSPRSTDDPINTITATGSGHKLAQPFLVKMKGMSNANAIDKPVTTLTTQNAMALAEPYLIHLRGTGTANDLNKPLPTVAANGKHYALCEPFLLEVNHGEDKKGNGDNRRVHDLDKTMGTVTTKNGVGVVQPFILQQQSGGSPRSTEKPLPTIACSGAQALIQPFIIPIDHTGRGDSARSVERPLSTITTENRHALIEPFVMKYNRTGRGKSVMLPLDTVTTKDRFALVQPEIIIDGERYLLDIRFRMLQPHELWRAQGFPTNYTFTGTKADKVKQIGNAVPRRLARALVIAVLTQNPDVTKYAVDTLEDVGEAA